MKYAITLAVILLLCCGMLYSGTDYREPEPLDIPAIVEAKDAEVAQLAAENAQLRRELLFIRIERCESSYRPDVYGKAGEYGQYQFKEATFNWMRGMSGLENLQWKSPADQELLARWAMENNLEKHWACYQIACDQWPGLCEEATP